VENKDEFAVGWREATLYRLVGDLTRVCLFFGGTDYEGLDANAPYSFKENILRDGDGDEIKLVRDSSCSDRDRDDVLLDLDDPELDEIEECGGGYLSNSGDDSEDDFLFGGDDGSGDKKIVKL
jgi:hypothetical protein